jgi:hypothetical protein
MLDPGSVPRCDRQLVDQAATTIAQQSWRPASDAVRSQDQQLRGRRPTSPEMLRSLRRPPERNWLPRALSVIDARTHPNFRVEDCLAPGRCIDPPQRFCDSNRHHFPNRYSPDAEFDPCTNRPRAPPGAACSAHAPYKPDYPSPWIPWFCSPCIRAIDKNLFVESTRLE